MGTKSRASFEQGKASRAKREDATRAERAAAREREAAALARRDRDAARSHEEPDTETSKEDAEEVGSPTAAKKTKSDHRGDDSPEFDAEITSRTNDNTLSAADAGALRGWSRLYAKFKSLGGQLGAKELLAGIKRGFSRAGQAAFRDRLFDAVLDLVFGPNNARAIKDQAALLREFVGDGLSIFPDSATKGEFNSRYRQRRLSDPKGDVVTIKDSGRKFDNPGKIELTGVKTRMGDGAVNVRRISKSGPQKEGNYALDDKAGSSLNRAQITDVVNLAISGGGKIRMGRGDYEGVIYMCDNETNADAIRKLIGDLDGAPGNVHVGYFNSDGVLTWVR